MSKYKKPLTPKEIAKVEDSDIDFSDIPELDADFWNNAEIVQPDTTQPVTLRIKKSVLEYFKAGGKGYQIFFFVNKYFANSIRCPTFFRNKM